MDTESLILVEHLSEHFVEALDAQQLAELEEGEKSEIMFFLEISRHIQEIEMLFNVFRFNLLNMLDMFTLTLSDELIRNGQINLQITDTEAIIQDKKASLEISDKIAINALLISFISSGKTLVKSIETFIQSDFSEEFKAPKGLNKEWISTIYDENFYYRFMIHLRDFAQHGHLPVSVTDSKFGFDLYQILNTPHFLHNAARRKQFESIVKEILEGSEYPRLGFTYHVAGYNLCITQLYVDFLRKSKSTFKICSRKLKSLVEKYSSNIIKSPDDQTGFFAFMLDDGKLHLLDPYSSILDTFGEFQKSAYSHDTRHKVRITSGRAIA